MGIPLGLCAGINGQTYIFGGCLTAHNQTGPAFLLRENVM